MKKYIIWFYLISMLAGISACKKSELLDKKPSTNIVTPTTLPDFQSLLDNTDIFYANVGLAQLASDDYTANYADLQTESATQRNSYIWAKDIYAGDVNIPDWNNLYTEIFYANSVLDGLSKSADASTTNGQYLKGWALFARSYAFYDLTRNFCKSYDSGTANTDLGIPLRLTSGIDYIEKRATLQQSFDQIIGDLNLAANLLPATRPVSNLNRPSKIAVYALLARIYLDMRDYTNAESFADQTLSLYNTLIDYNTVSATSSTPFTTTNNELIYNTNEVFYDFTADGGPALISQNLISLYNSKDLRLNLFYDRQPDGTYFKKRGYYGSGHYPFGGLATDEVYLIKAECLARRGQTTAAMDKLNQLLVKRFVNTSTYVPLSASTAQDALSFILSERRKELVWRGLRWHDLKRLNKEGANIILTRVYNGVTYTLPPNDPKYVFPIPDDEISLSGIQQNNR
jgi:hypothetical protein